MSSFVHSRSLPTLELGDIRPDTLRTVARDTGAFHLVGHGIRPAVPAEVVDLARLFFALPEADKAAVDASASEQFRGHTAFGTGAELGWREQFDLGAELPVVPARQRRHPGEALVGPNQWPARVPALRDRALWFQDRATEVARAVLRQLAVDLGLAADLFDLSLAGDPATWTTLARETRSAASPTGGHTDAGILTLRWIDPQTRGIQVLGDHRWVDADVASDAFLVTIGDALEEATDGYLRAPAHRWLPAAGERVTLTYTFDAPVPATLPHLDLPERLVEEWTTAA